MLTIFDNVGRQLDILLNAKKSLLFKLVKSIGRDDREQLQIGNSTILWSNNMKYLGLNLNMFYHTDVDYLFCEYNVNFSLSLSAVYRKFCDICFL